VHASADTLGLVEHAVRAVRRADFLPPEQLPHALRDGPLPIGYEQTISQPSLVAEMTRQLAISRDSRVLEIGTGSGFQTAILAEIGRDVFTIERIPELAGQARARPTALGYRNIHFRTGDGSLGWPEAAPFDAIIGTAAPVDVPPALIEQLAPGGRLVIPIGADRDNQMLVRIDKDAHGATCRTELFGVRFVPMVSGEKR
jgi:protein-L-isoaspartate(D-aspartate) O-methyltransferase